MVETSCDAHHGCYWTRGKEKTEEEDKGDGKEKRERGNKEWKER